MAPGEIVIKKQALRLEQLASYDDLLTDALVDRVYFWSTIRKNRARYSACRGIREEEITNIIRQNAVIDKDPAKASAELLKLVGIQRFFERLSADEKEHFQRHLRKYASIYMPDCPFEVHTTNRYTIDTQEAAATARKPIKKGELIKYLSGVQVAMTKEEEKDLDLTRRDFSIVMSSRKRTPSLFLGPARFANHDCDANARLTTRGSNGMTVVAAKDIAVGDEITVSYGNDYFGIDNCECLCMTCEELQRNGWAPYIAIDDEDDEGSVAGSTRSVHDTSPYGFRHARRDSSEAVPRSGTATPEHTPCRKRKLGDLTEGPENQKSLVANPRLEGLKRRARVKCDFSSLSQEVRLEDSEDQNLETAEATLGRSTSPSSTLEGSLQSSLFYSSSTSGTSFSGPALGGENHLDDTVQATAGTAFEVPLDVPSLDIDDPHAILEQSDDIPVVISGNSSVLSDLPDELDVDDASQQVIKRKAPLRITRLSLTQLSRLQRKSLQGSETPVSPAPDGPLQLNPRKPGDYTLTHRLLSTPYSRWVECRVCDNAFVQYEAYQTRWSCPRCERHSKLYGYQYPKTDRAGKHDNEERITDPRMVHRFVWADEEKEITKGKSAHLRRLLEEEVATNSDMDSSAVENNMPKKSRKADRDEAQSSPAPRGSKRWRGEKPWKDIPKVKKTKKDPKPRVPPPEEEAEGRGTVCHTNGRYVGRWVYLPVRPIGTTEQEDLLAAREHTKGTYGYFVTEDGKRQRVPKDAASPQTRTRSASRSTLPSTGAKQDQLPTSAKRLKGVHRININRSGRRERVPHQSVPPLTGPIISEKRPSTGGKIAKADYGYIFKLGRRQRIPLSTMSSRAATFSTMSSRTASNEVLPSRTSKRPRGTYGYIITKQGRRKRVPLGATSLTTRSDSSEIEVPPTTALKRPKGTYCYIINDSGKRQRVSLDAAPSSVKSLPTLKTTTAATIPMKARKPNTSAQSSPGRRNIPVWAANYPSVAPLGYYTRRANPSVLANPSPSTLWRWKKASEAREEAGTEEVSAKLKRLKYTLFGKIPKRPRMTGTVIPVKPSRLRAKPSETVEAMTMSDAEPEVRTEAVKGSAKRSYVKNSTYWQKRFGGASGPVEQEQPLSISPAVAKHGGAAKIKAVKAKRPMRRASLGVAAVESDKVQDDAEVEARPMKGKGSPGNVKKLRLTL